MSLESFLEALAEDANEVDLGDFFETSGLLHVSFAADLSHRKYRRKLADSCDIGR